jgi:thiamine biosynthesis protein ThiI
VFGVAYAAPAELLTKPTLDDITQAIAELAQRRLSPGQSFAVRAHRSTPGAIARRDVEREGGSSVLGAMKDNAVTVDLDAPDVKFYVDLVGNDAYVYCEKLRGPGGLPLSAQWKMLAVLDSGPLSILAACAMMRRGSVVELFIPASNMIAQLSSQTQLSLAQRVGRLVTRPNYKAFVLEIDEVLNDRQRGDWRWLVRAMAVKFARENRFKGVVFGDISGRLSSLRGGYSRLTQLPIFYPLLGLEREDLTELSRLVGVEQTEMVSQFELEHRTVEPQGELQSLIEELQVPPVREVKF